MLLDDGTKPLAEPIVKIVHLSDKTNMQPLNALSPVRQSLSFEHFLVNRNRPTVIHLYVKSSHAYR